MRLSHGQPQAGQELVSQRKMLIFLTILLKIARVGLRTTGEAPAESAARQRRSGARHSFCLAFNAATIRAFARRARAHFLVCALRQLAQRLSVRLQASQICTPQTLQCRASMRAITSTASKETTGQPGAEHRSIVRVRLWCVTSSPTNPGIRTSSKRTHGAPG
jgi:hypothetical protein